MPKLKKREKKLSFYSSGICFPFGKYKGKRVSIVMEHDPEYIQWYIENIIPQKHNDLISKTIREIEYLKKVHVFIKTKL